LAPGEGEGSEIPGESDSSKKNDGEPGVADALRLVRGS
jgi:hypothetical protein